MKKKFKKFFSNNKAFTLVELIIVIAVLSIVAVVVSPMFLEYVEKGRMGTDRNAIGEVGHAAEVVFVKRASSDGVEFKIRIDNQGNAIYGGAGGGNFVDDVKEIVPPEVYVYKSEAYRGHTVTISVDEDGVAHIDDNIAENRGAWTAEDLGITNPLVAAGANFILDKVSDETWEEINKAIFELDQTDKQWDDMTSDEKLEFIKDKAAELSK